MHDSKDPTQLITTGQAGQLREPPCSPENIRRLVRLGRIRPVAVVGHGQMIFDRADKGRAIGEDSAAWFERHGGIGLASNWLALLERDRESIR